MSGDANGTATAGDPVGEPSAGDRSGRGLRQGPALVVLAVVATSVGGGLVQSRSDRRWYQGLRKPPGQPPAWLFGPVWSVLYAVIAWSGIRLWRTLDPGDRKRAKALWAAQLAANAAWTPLFFGLRLPRVALADQLVLDGLAIALRRELGHVDPPAAKALDAYLAWLGFATYLNAGIVVRNR